MDFEIISYSINQTSMEEIQKQPSTSSPYLIPGSIILAGFLIAGAVVYTNGSRSAQVKPAQQPTPWQSRGTSDGSGI